MQTKKLWLSVLSPLFLLILWQLTCTYGQIPVILLPSPGAVLQAFFELTGSGELWRDITASASRTLTGFCISSVTGILLAFVLSQSRRLTAFLKPILEALRVTPPLALIPLLILWLGINEAPKVAIVVLSSFFPIFLNTVTALQSKRTDLTDVGHLMGFTRWEMWRYVTLPMAVPGILTGLRLGFGYAWRALVGAELIAASSGLGWLISESAEFGKTAHVFVGILTIVVLGTVADALFKRAVQWLARKLEQPGDAVC